MWKANHVWLDRRATVTWTAYPGAFGSLASTLSVALFVAGLGMIVRGAAYALRGGGADPREIRADRRRVGDLVGADAVRAGRRDRRDGLGPRAGRQRQGRPHHELAEPDVGLHRGAGRRLLRLPGRGVPRGRRGPPRGGDLVAPFRRRALGAGALGRRRWRSAAWSCSTRTPTGCTAGCVAGDGLPALIVSVLAGVATFGLVVRARFEPARYRRGAGGRRDRRRVGAGPAAELPARPDRRAGRRAARRAGGDHRRRRRRRDHALPVAGAAVPADARRPAGPRPTRSARRRRRPARRCSAPRPGCSAASPRACFVAGVGLLTVAEAGWAHAIGVVALFGFVVVGFLGAVPALLLSEPRA